MKFIKLYTILACSLCVLSNPVNKTTDEYEYEYINDLTEIDKQIANSNEITSLIKDIVDNDSKLNKRQVARCEAPLIIETICLASGEMKYGEGRWRLGMDCTLEPNWACRTCCGVYKGCKYL